MSKSAAKDYENLVDALTHQDESIARIKAASKGDGQVTRTDIQLLAAAFGGDMSVLLELLPAEAVPEEIQGAWRELRSSQPLVAQIEKYVFE